jgi:hypothetical protein
MAHDIKKLLSQSEKGMMFQHLLQPNNVDKPPPKHSSTFDLGSSCLTFA